MKNFIVYYLQVDIIRYSRRRNVTRIDGKCSVGSIAAAAPNKTESLINLKNFILNVEAENQAQNMIFRGMRCQTHTHKNFYVMFMMMMSHKKVFEIFIIFSLLNLSQRRAKECELERRKFFTHLLRIKHRKLLLRRNTRDSVNKFPWSAFTV
jgi:hypothetical protein